MESNVFSLLKTNHFPLGFRRNIWQVNWPHSFQPKEIGEILRTLHSALEVMACHFLSVYRAVSFRFSSSGRIYDFLPSFPSPLSP